MDSITNFLATIGEEVEDAEEGMSYARLIVPSFMSVYTYKQP